MDIQQALLERQLGSDFPLCRDEPFTTAMAREAGLSDNDLGALVQGGLLRRLVRGVYVDATVPDSIELRAAALRLIVPDDCVVVDRHAGWLLGAQMVLAPGEHLALRPLSLFRPSGNGRVRNGIVRSGERRLRDEDITTVAGLRVTTPLRTAWDLGRVRWTDEAISGLDAMFRLNAFSRDDFLGGIAQFRGQRWITTLRVIGPLADGRSESPGESVLRLRCHEANLDVVPQVEVFARGRFIARVDLGNERLRCAVEYNGVEWHSSPDQLEHDAARRAELLADGWLVAEMGKDETFGRARDCDQILRCLKTDAERRTRFAA